MYKVNAEHIHTMSIMRYPQLLEWIRAKSKILFFVGRNLCNLTNARVNICHEVTRINIVWYDIDKISYFCLKMSRLFFFNSAWELSEKEVASVYRMFSISAKKDILLRAFLVSMNLTQSYELYEYL